MNNKLKTLGITLTSFLLGSLIMVGANQAIQAIQRSKMVLLSKKDENKEQTEDLKELKDFDITVESILNMMPSWPSSDAGLKEAYFWFDLSGIDPKQFFNDYEIETIELNNCKIENQKIIYEYDSFRFYSPNYKNDNIIFLIIKNKNTNERYFKNIDVKMRVVM